MRGSSVLPAALLLAPKGACDRRLGTEPPPVATRPLPAEEQALIRTARDFGLRLVQMVVQDDEKTERSRSGPRFHLRYGRKLNDQFNRMSEAHFSRLFEWVKHCYIGCVLQTGLVQVDHAGTEAAAATVVGIGPGDQVVSFRVYRPFVFFMRRELSCSPGESSSRSGRNEP